MYDETVTKISDAAKSKVTHFKASPFRYLVASLLAGAYVGFGIILIFSIGAPFAAANSPALKLVMGASFGVALTLVIIAGSELFTGLNMVMTLGVCKRKVSLVDLIVIWIVAWAGNVLGALGIAFIFSKTGLMANPVLSGFLNTVAMQKMSAPLLALFARGVLCNMLVCLAVWMCFRVSGDGAKLGVIFWCLFAFIGSGFEHSVANMSLLAIPLFSGPSDGVTWLGYARNLGIVTAGNAVGGALLIALPYFFVSAKSRREETSREN